MPATSRRQQLEQMLESDPKDAFLRYALAMEMAGEGDNVAAVRVFGEVIADSPEYAAAYHQCGQLLARINQTEDAKAVLQRGVVAARNAGDLHAAEEMQGLLQSLE